MRRKWRQYAPVDLLRWEKNGESHKAVFGSRSAPEVSIDNTGFLKIDFKAGSTVVTVSILSSDGQLTREMECSRKGENIGVKLTDFIEKDIQVEWSTISHDDDDTLPQICTFNVRRNLEIVGLNNLIPTEPKEPTPPPSPRPEPKPEPKEEASRLWPFVGIGAASVVGIGVAVYMASYIPALRPVTKPIMDLGSVCANFIINICNKTFGRE